MSIKEKLTADMKSAMKAKEKNKLTLIRMVQSEIKNAEIKAQRDLSEDEIVAVIDKVKVQTAESHDMYLNAGNAEQTAKHAEWLEVIAEYLPKQLTEDEVRSIISAVIAEKGLSGKKDIGKVMPAIMPILKGKYDSKKINPLVVELLG